MRRPTASGHDISLITHIGTAGYVPTSYGPEAHEALASIAQETKNGDPLKPMTVVVPSHYVGIAAARALSAEGAIGPQQRGITAIDFTTIHELAERLGGPRMAATGRHPVSNAVIAGAVRAVLRDDPGHFAAVTTHPATERSLVEAHRELSEMDHEGLNALTAQSSRAADVVRVHRAVAEILKYGFSNEQQVVDEAVAALNDDAKAVERLGPVVVFLPQHLKRSQVKLLRAVASATETTMIVGLTGHPEADLTVEASLRRLGASVNRQDTPREPENASTGIAALRRILQGRRVQALSVSDADDEVRHAVRAVIAAARSGTRLGRCAILYGSSQPYARLVVDALDAAGVKRCGSTVYTVGTSWLGRSLLGLLALRGDGFTRRGMMAWLDTANLMITHNQGQRTSLQDEDSADQDEDSASATSTGFRSMPAPVAAWERVARAARLESDINEWDHRLKAYIHSCRLKAESLKDDDDQAWLYRRCEQDADQAETLLAFARSLHDHLHPKPVARTWIALTKWCHSLVRGYLGGRRRNGWPTDERQLAAGVDTAIDRLSGLDDIDPEPSYERFLQALEAELNDGAYRTVGPFGAGVLVGSPDLALGVELDFAVVCGLAEGVFPSRRQDSPLLPGGGLRSISDAVHLPTDRISDDIHPTADRISDDHRHFLAVLSAANRVLLMYPRGDLRRNADNPPSRWLIDVAEAKNPNGIRPKGADLAHASDWLHEEPSFVTGLRSTDFPASQQEYDMRSLLDQRERCDTQTPIDRHGQRQPGEHRELREHRELTANLEPVQSQHADTRLLYNTVVGHRIELKRGIETRLARQSARLTRFDGNLCTDGDLRGVELPDPLGPESVMSASRLEAWAKCPHAYFVKNLLGVNTIDDDQNHYRISPLDLGGLFHRILERWLKDAIETDEPPPPGQPWPEKWQRRLIEIGEEECEQLEAGGLSGRKLYWHSDRRRLFTDLRRFIEFDNEMRNHHRSTPIAAELGFGLHDSEGYGPTSIRLNIEHDNTNTQPAVEPENGRLLRIKGSIDRIDATAAGGLVVVDYKTGSDYRYKRLQADEPTPEGGHLQLVLYALAARSVFPTNHITPADSNTADPRSTGTPHEQAPVPQRSICNENDYGEYWFVTSKGGFTSKGYRVESAREQVLTTIAAIVSGIQSGLFPMRPAGPRQRAWVDCHFCDPDGLGTRTTSRDWKRKLEDPTLSGYTDLITSGGTA